MPYSNACFGGAKFDLGPYISGGQFTTLTTQGMALNEMHVFSATVVNEISHRLCAQTRLPRNRTTAINPPPLWEIMGINVNPFSSGFPAINIQDFTSINAGPAFLPANPKQTSIQIGDTLSWTKGRHQLKFGYCYVRNLVSPFANSNPRSQIYFNDNFTNNPGTNSGGNGFADWLLGCSTSGSRGFLLSRYYMTNQEHGAFVQDDFKLNQRLTLKLGLRYDLFPPDVELRNRLSNFDFNTLSLVYAGAGRFSNTASVQTRKNNFGPHVGFRMIFLVAAGRWFVADSAWLTCRNRFQGRCGEPELQSRCLPQHFFRRSHHRPAFCNHSRACSAVDHC